MSKLKLEGELALDGSGWEKTIAQAEHSAAHLAHETLSELKGAFAGAFALGTIEAAIHSAIEFGEEIKNTATRLGVSTTAAQEFSFAAGQTGTDLEHVATGMGKLAKALTAIEEGSMEAGKMERAFHRLGISVSEIQGKSPEEVFKIIGEKMEGMTVTAGVTTSMMELFGKSGGKLIPMLKELSENMESAHDKGLILDPGAIEALDDAAKTMKILGIYSKEIGAGLAVDLKLATTGWYDYAKALYMTKEAFDNTTGKYAVAAMEKTLNAQQALRADLEAHTKRTTVDETDRTADEMHENTRTADELRKDTARRRSKREETHDDEGSTEERINKVNEKIKELQKAAKQFDAGSLPAVDIENQIEKAKDKLEELQKKNREEALKTLEKGNKSPHQIKADPMVSMGNFLGHTARDIPAIQEKLVRAHQETTTALNRVAAALGNFNHAGQAHNSTFGVP